MELLRRFHVLLELCHALDRLLLRVREADAFGKRDGGNPHQLAGAQRVLLAQSDGRQGTDAALAADLLDPGRARSEEHTSELQSLMRISSAVFCLKKQTRLTKTRKNVIENT